MDVLMQDNLQACGMGQQCGVGVHRQGVCSAVGTRSGWCCADPQALRESMQPALGQTKLKGKVCLGRTQQVQEGCL